MTSFELEAFAESFKELWGKELTREQQKVFMLAAEGCDAQKCLQALRSHALESRFPIRPFELRKRLDAALGIVAEKGRKDAEEREWGEYVASCAADRDERDRLFSQLSDSDKLKHKTSALVDTRLTWIKNSPIDSAGWRWILSKRIKDGMETHDPGIYVGSENEY